MKNEDAEFDPVADLHERQRRIRQEMGGADRVAKMKKDGVPTIRDHIEGLLDQGTFRELGTHSRSMRLEDRSSTPGDGKVGGEGEVNGISVVIFFFKQKTAYEIGVRLVGSEMCIRDSQMYYPKLKILIKEFLVKKPLIK